MASVILCSAIQAADAQRPGPLASIKAPACSNRAGVRAARSDLIQFGDITASLSAQSSHENDACLQSAALWVTQKGVSQQYELHDAAQTTFTILDVSANSGAILISSSTAVTGSDENRVVQIATLSLADGSFAWISVTGLFAFANCDAAIEPQGFLDSTHVLIAALPATVTRKRPNCPANPEYHSLDLVSHTLHSSTTKTVQRLAKAISGPVRSCKADPDVVAACYTTRARLAVTDNPWGLSIWPVGSNHTLAVEEGMLPGDLGSRVNSHMRVYATMVVCPLFAAPASRPHICVDSATNFVVDPIRNKVAHAVDSQTIVVTIDH